MRCADDQRNAAGRAAARTSGRYALVVCSVVSIVLFPLLVPAIALIVLGLRNSGGRPGELWGVVLAVALVATFAVVVFHQDPVTWDGGSSSNIVTTAEATLSIAVAICVLGAGWALATVTARS